MRKTREEVITSINIILVVTMLILLICACKMYENSYSIDAKVSNVQGETVTFVDSTDNLWMWTLEEGESYTKGEEVKLYFNDNNTDVRYDDVITKVRTK